MGDGDHAFRRIRPIFDQRRVENCLFCKVFFKNHNFSQTTLMTIDFATLVLSGGSGRIEGSTTHNKSENRQETIILIPDLKIRFQYKATFNASLLLRSRLKRGRPKTEQRRPETGHKRPNTGQRTPTRETKIYCKRSG